MTWLTAPLRKVAPPVTAQIAFAPDDQVWQLSLDQIESESGEIVEKRYAAASDAGTSTFNFDTGNVLYSKLRPYLNKVAVPDEAGIATTELIPLRPDPKTLNPRFLAYYLRSPGFVNQASHHVAGAKMPRVVMDWFWAHEAPIPSPREQSRIVELLDEANRLRRLRREADAKAARILPALFLKMFGDPATNPMGWPMKPLGDLADQRPEYGANASACPRKGVMPRYVRITDIRDNGTLSEKESVSLDSDDWRRYLLHDGDVLFARSGNTVGKTYIYRPDDGPCAFAGYLIRFQFRSGAVDPWFVFGVTRTAYYRGWVESHKRVAGQPNINGQEYSGLLTPEPPQPLQQKFGKLAKEIEQVLTKADSAAEQLEATFSTLLLHAFSGQLTAQWREGHLRELLAEMAQQARALNLPMPKELEALP
ncbi:MAG: restriction endonuclease subunit S [Gammaproteobacteria bacterium]|nr:restriction endonuclease subunit S [Gammaproteobacteria bacterium]